MSEGATNQNARGKRLLPDGDESQLLDSRGVSRCVFYSLLCGATSLIPLPFIDDWIFGLLRRFFIRDVLERNGCRLTHDQIRFLARRTSPWKNRGCLYQAGYFLVIGPITLGWYILKKIFKKILFILMAKEATDRAVESFHEWYLLALFNRGMGSASAALDDVQLVNLQESLHQTMQETDPSPLRHIFLGMIKLNKKTLTHSARFLLRVWNQIRRKEPRKARNVAADAIEHEEASLQKVTDQTAEKLIGQRGYLINLGQRFGRGLEAANQRIRSN
jgi:hypothetical protein